jgi:hypothetical protein
MNPKAMRGDGIADGFLRRVAVKSREFRFEY